MGSGQSVRATHFQRPNTAAADPMDPDNMDEHHISISNKMVERLVEDATLTGGAELGAATPKGDYKEKIFMEKFKCLDESHSERCGITMEDVNALINRVEMRTDNMVSVEPVCADCQERVIACYDTAARTQELVQCWDTVGAFSACVAEAGAERLRARAERDAAADARRTRRVARARLDLEPGV